MISLLSGSQTAALVSAFITSALISSGRDGVSWRSGLLYGLHPVTLCSALLAAEHGWLDGLGDLCLAAAMAGARDESACFGAVAALLTFFLVSPVQGACVALPLLAATCRRSSQAARAGVGWRDVALAATAALAALLALGGGGALAGARGGGAAGARLETLLDFPRSRVALAAVAPGFLGPDPGLYWYLFDSVFLSALPYFTLLIWTAGALVAAPACARLGACEASAIIAAGAAAIFDASVSGGGVRRLLLIAALCARARDARGGDFTVHRMARARTLVAAGLLNFSAAAAPAMKHLWLRSGGTGNANFAFNHQLVIAASASALLADFARAAVQARDESSVVPQARAADIQSKNEDKS
jgi:hypothetical protein